MNPYDEIFKKLAGQQIEDACDMCDATSSIEEVVPGVHSLTIAHDPSCPILRASRRGTN
jgi:hypothetical protein